MRDGGDAVFEARDYVYNHLDKRRSDFVEGETPPATDMKLGEALPTAMPPAEDENEDE
jgi:hypothetical protein